MLCKPITYVDFNGVERTENFCFNLTKAELAEMDLTTEGGLEVMLRKIIDSKDIPSLISVFKKIILKSYGIKSDDGKRFIKSEEISQAFTETQAYSDLFMELASDADKAAAFVNGIMPPDIVSEAEKVKSLNPPTQPIQFNPGVTH